jgi:YD repeat-containing protein
LSEGSADAPPPLPEARGDQPGEDYMLYDLLNRQVKAQARAAVGSPDPAAWQTTAYDADGNVTAQRDPAIAGDATGSTYDDLNRLASSTDAWGTTTTYAYDADGNVAAKATAGVGTTRYAYDGLDRLASLTDPQGTVTTYASYDPEGRLLEKRLPNATHVDYAYDAAGRLRALRNRRGASHSASEAVIADYEARYDGTGQKVSETRPEGSFTYSYDALGRLRQVTQGSTTRSYGFDQNSNRTSLTVDGQLAKTYTYDALDRLVDIRDANGMHLEWFSYYASGEVKTHAAPSFSRSYTYDPRGLPTGETQGSDQVRYTLDALGRVLRETQSGGSPRDLRLLYADATDRPVATADPGTGAIGTSYQVDPGGLLATRAGGTTRYASWSLHGDLVQEADPSGALRSPAPLAYDEFGIPQGTGATPYGWTGETLRQTSRAPRRPTRAMDRPPPVQAGPRRPGAYPSSSRIRARIRSANPSGTRPSRHLRWISSLKSRSNP